MDSIKNLFSFNILNFFLAVIGPVIISVFTGIPLDLKTIAVFLAAIVVYTASILFYKCNNNKKEFKFSAVYNAVYPWIIWIIILFCLKLALNFMFNPLLMIGLNVLSGTVGVFIVALIFFYPYLKLSSDCFY